MPNTRFGNWDIKFFLDICESNQKGNCLDTCFIISFFFFSHELSLVKSVFFSEHTVGCLFTRTETWADWNIHENIHYDTFKGFWEFYVVSRKIFEDFDSWYTSLWKTDPMEDHIANFFCQITVWLCKHCLFIKTRKKKLLTLAKLATLF